MKDRGTTTTTASDFYALADALAMKFEVDIEPGCSWHLKGKGDITVDIGQFKVRLVLETISTVVEDDANVAFIVSCGSGHLGLFVTFSPKTKKTTVSPIDLSKLPKDGADYFEAATIMTVETAWDMLLAELGPLRTFEGNTKGWIEECRAPSSSGSDPAAAPTP